MYAYLSGVATTVAFFMMIERERYAFWIVAVLFLAFSLMGSHLKRRERLIRDTRRQAARGPERHEDEIPLL